MLTKILAFLDGKKTYLAAAGYVVYAVVQAVVLKDIPGAGQSLLTALTVAGLRAAVAKNGVGA